MVNSQLKIFTPVGIEMIIVVMPKKALTLAPEPMVKKWCSHTMNDSTPMQAVAHHALVAEQRLARERGDDFGEHTERRQDQDVHLR